MKSHGHGQAAIISEVDYVKIRKAIYLKKYKLLLDIARYTGERWGAIVQLQVGDVFNADGTPKTEITFRAQTRKASPGGKRQTRSCPVHASLVELLEAYPIPQGEWLFESRSRPGRPITLQAADRKLRQAVEKAGLSHKGYSTHSTRRTFITTLHEKGCDIHTIQKLTGHHDLRSLVLYVDVSSERLQQAISVL